MARWVAPAVAVIINPLMRVLSSITGKEYLGLTAKVAVFSITNKTMC